MQKIRINTIITYKTIMTTIFRNSNKHFYPTGTCLRGLFGSTKVVFFKLKRGLPIKKTSKKNEYGLYVTFHIVFSPLQRVTSLNSFYKWKHLIFPPDMRHCSADHSHYSQHQGPVINTHNNKINCKAQNGISE